MTATVNKEPKKFTQKSDAVNAYGRAKEKIKWLGFKWWILNYIEFVEDKNKRDIEV